MPAGKLQTTVVETEYVLEYVHGLPRSGQTTIYQDGDDGDLEKGLTYAASRAAEFVDNGDGTVSDLATGLMWMKNYIVPILGEPTPATLAIGNIATSATGRSWSPTEEPVHYDVGELVYYTGSGEGCYICIQAHDTEEAGIGSFELPPLYHSDYWRYCPFAASSDNLTTAKTFSWEEALWNMLYINQQLPQQSDVRGFAGYTDWRMPSLAEMLSIVNPEAPAATAGLFPVFVSTPVGHKADHHWTSTTAKGYYTNYAYVWNQGTSGLPGVLDKTSLKTFRPVRGG